MQVFSKDAVGKHTGFSWFMIKLMSGFEVVTLSLRASGMPTEMLPCRGTHFIYWVLIYPFIYKYSVIFNVYKHLFLINIKYLFSKF